MGRRIEFDPTEEQLEIVAHAGAGHDTKVQALAGAGKTSTTKLIARELRRQRGLYLAFNKKVKEDAERAFRGTNVKVMTTYGMAVPAVGKHFMHRLNVGKMPYWRVAQTLGIRQPVGIEVLPNMPPMMLREAALARHAKDTLLTFCRSADTEIGRQHVPWIPNIDRAGKRANNDALAPRFVEWAEKLWDDALDRQGTRFPYEHAYYLKIFQMSGPVLPQDFILLDEAQDTNECVIDIIEQQLGTQRFIVGDSRQAIYEWNGATDALRKMTAKVELPLTRSFRFGAEIADAANEVLYQLESEHLLEGAGGSGVVHFQPDEDRGFDAVLGRSNAAVIGEALHRIADDERVCVQGGTSHVTWFADDALVLMEGDGPVDHPDLVGFTHWDQVEKMVESGDADRDLELLFKLVGKFGATKLKEMLELAVPPAQADVTCSTAHKAKGAEWNRVKLLPDFPVWEEEPPLSELRLLYVAATRAKSELDVSSVEFDPWIEARYSNPPPPPSLLDDHGFREVVDVPVGRLF